MARFTGTKFWLLGAAYWLMIAALFWGALQLWPHLHESAPFFTAAILGAVVGGFAIVYLLQQKS